MSTISWWRTTFGEEEISRIAGSIRHEHISQGPVTAEFERSIAGILDVPCVVATTSGSTALLMACIAAGIGPGDEVIVPNRTWIATAHAPYLLGAKVVLVDVEADYPIMDVTGLEQKITSWTKAIMPVHLNGRSAALDEVNRIAEAHGLKVIEDASQAFCSRNIKGFLGAQSYAGCFSLSVAKLISTGQGGFVVTGSEETYEQLKMMRTHGVSDVINAEFSQMGFNFRFTDIQASIGLAQLERLKGRIERLEAVYERYAVAIPELPFLKFIPVNIEAGEIPLYIEVLCSERDKLIRFLADNGIQARPFYPGLDSAVYFECVGDYPNSRKFGEQGLFLPCGPDQPIENVDRVIEILKLYGRQR